MSETGHYEIWFREDIENSLRAVQATMLAMAPTQNSDAQKVAFCQGFMAALDCVARVYGVELLPSRTQMEVTTVVKE